ncbi:MAG: chemotaxis protein CheW [Defluviitaleaceae bacterium]|nr:chemotaxis protein CheW [Defluviitaleaceae bacterium]
MDDFDRGAMLESFIQEMGILVDQLENTMVQTGEVYTKEQINEIFRIMHTIKGSASMMLFTEMADVTHSAEDLFFFLRENTPTVDVDYATITDLVLESVDFIKLQLAHMEDGETLDEKPPELMKNLKDCLSNIKGEGEGTDAATAQTSAGVQPTQGLPVATGDVNRYSALIFFQEGSEMENVRAFTVIHNLKDVATDVVTVPGNVLDEDSIWSIRSNGFRLEFSSNHSLEQIRNTLMQSIYIKDMQLEKISGEADPSTNVYMTTIKFQAESQMENVRAFALVNNIKDTVTILKQHPGDLLDQASAEVIRKKGFTMTVATDLNYRELESILQQTIYLEELTLSQVESAAQPTNQDATEDELAKEGVALLASAGDSDPLVDAFGQLGDTVSAAPPAIAQAVAVESTPAPVAAPVLATSTAASDAPRAKRAASSSVGMASDNDDSDQSKEKAGAKKPTTHSINVNVNKLDQLLNLVGELVISEAMVTQNPELEGLELESFTKESRQLRKIITEIQYTVMSMRMVPLAPTFFKMHRIVRDMCRQLKKDVHLEVIGDETEVDKNIIEHISDPLMHIIRNSLDHGIEKPEIRMQKGKSGQGTVTLEAKNSGGDVLIIIKDDGAGFNKEKILEKAYRNGLLVKPEEEYTEKEIYQFIFYPGFSTNESVTTFSGRGVGMDVVNTNLDHVGGTVIADSIEGEGSSITLKIPLTLAIIDGMLIKIGNDKYTIPIMDIRRSLKVTKNDIIFDPNGNEMIKIRGEVYNLVRLNNFFGLDIGYENVEDGIVLMLENGEKTVCVFADELVGEQQIVVKNIPKYIKKVHGLSGCTLLGNGDISLIVNVPAFFDV